MSRKLTPDRLLFGAAVLAVLVGLVMIYSASAIIAIQKTGGENPYLFLVKQIVWLGVGLIAMLALMHIDPALLRDNRVVTIMLVAIFIALVLVLFQAKINGTHRWFIFPGFRFQPAELAKPIVVLSLATFLAQREDRIDEWKGTLLPIMGVLGSMACLIVLQPDFGTAAMLVLVAGVLIFVAGLSWKRILLLGLPLLPLAGWLIWSASYRRDRMFVFLNPEADPLDKGFQALQSLIAIGTGGFWGLGLGNGRQKLFFLPEPHTDFIFSIIGEELGFVGAILLIGLFAFLVWRGFVIARGSRDRFSFYAALGMTLMIGVQALLNISVALCLLPTKGLPLPLVSYGGSSLIASMICVGVLLNLSQETV